MSSSVQVSEEERELGETTEDNDEGGTETVACRLHQYFSEGKREKRIEFR